MKIESKYNIGDAFYLPLCTNENIVKTVVHDGKEYYNCSEIYKANIICIKLYSVEFKTDENNEIQFKYNFVSDDDIYYDQDDSELKFYTQRDDALKIAQKYADKQVEYRPQWYEPDLDESHDN